MLLLLLFTTDEDFLLMEFFDAWDKMSDVKLFMWYFLLLP